MTRGCVVLLLAACGRLGFDEGTDAAATRAATFSTDFESGQLGAVIFQRGSPASYVGADRRLHVATVDEARFDHDPMSGELRGLLIERPSANLIRYSDVLERQFEWFVNNAMTVNVDVAIAPDGTMSAEELVDTELVFSARDAQGATIPDDALPYSCSGFMKAGTTTLASFGCELLGGSQQIQTEMDIDLAIGAIVRPPPSTLSYGIEPYGDGWYRVHMTLLNTQTGNNNIILSFWGLFSNSMHTGSFYAWGAQIEQSATVTSYIPTAAAQLPRAADVAKLIELSWFNQMSGSVLADVALARIHPDTQPAACLVAMDPDTTCIARSGSAQAAMVSTGATPLVTGGSWQDGKERTLVVTWDASMTALHEATSVASTVQPLSSSATLAELAIGSDGSRFFDGWVRELTVWPFVLGADELTQLGVR
jgi:hypothetical protein